jgi:hypothetical protein
MTPREIIKTAIDILKCVDVGTASNLRTAIAADRVEVARKAFTAGIGLYAYRDYDGTADDLGKEIELDFNAYALSLEKEG